MPQFDDNHVKLCGGYVVWDGVHAKQDTNPDGSPKYSIKVVFPPTCPDLPIFDQLASKTLAESKWRGQLPPGGMMPIQPVKPGAYNGSFDGWVQISFKTKYKPDIYDENGQAIDPMQLAHVLYTGQKVDVLAHCYAYDNKGNQGVSAGLDAFAVILSAQAPVQKFGGNEFASAFGGGGAQPAQQAPAQQYAQPAQQAPAQQYAQPAQQAPAQQYAQPAQQAPAQQPVQQPQQAHNFLPNT